MELTIAGAVLRVDDILLADLKVDPAGGTASGHHIERRAFCVLGAIEFSLEDLSGFECVRGRVSGTVPSSAE